MGLTEPSARTLTEALRRFSDDQLATLFDARPDLAYPLPRDLSELAAQAATGPSIRRAVDRLNRWQREVLEAVAAAADPAGLDDLADLLGSSVVVVREPVTVLRGMALLWGSEQALRLVRSVRDYFGPYPAGLAPPSAQPLDPAQIETALTAAGADTRPVLQRLVWGPPTGAVRNADRSISVAQAESPVERLLAHRLLSPAGRDTVILPREVALWLRREQSASLISADPPAPEPPALLDGPDEPSNRTPLLDRAATGAALSLLHDVDVTVQALQSESVQLLRDGRISHRDLGQLSRRVGSSERDPGYPTFVVELAAGAGLIAGRPGLRLLPTTGYDRWLAEPAPLRWRQLAEAWSTVNRYPLAAAEDGASPLSPDAGSARAAETRQLIVTTAATAPTGTQIDLDRLAEVVRWQRPGVARPVELLRRVIDWTFREMGWLGLTALGATTSYLTVVAAAAELPNELTALFPEPIESVIIQSDLTAVAPGPLTRQVSTDLRSMAEEESRGGGSVYRFGPASLRRAFDLGWAAADLHQWLATHSSTGVPQPLAYLIDDVARQHGSIRVGPAEAVLRIDDPAQQAALLNHPAAGELRLRQLAPGVLAASATPEDVVALLHRIGLTPIAEDADGRALAPRPPERAASPAVREPAANADPRAAAAAVLAAERRRPRPNGAGSNGAGSNGASGQTTDDSVASLTRASRLQSKVQVGYVTPDGTRTERVLDAVRMMPGSVQAMDIRTARPVSIPLARIHSVRPIGPDISAS